MNDIITKDGIHNTKIPNVKLYKASVPVLDCPFLYDNQLVILLQGSKIVKTSKEHISYNTNKYLVVPTTLPVEVKSSASKKEPLISIVIFLDKKMIFDIFDKLDFKERKIKKSSEIGLFTDVVTPDIEDIVYRLLKCLQSKNDSMILGKMLLKELFYRIILGDKSMFLHKLFLNTSVEAKISRIIRRIHEQYNEYLDVKTLSNLESMSVSSFHTHFKKVTSYSPKQYIKKLRLTKANDLLSNYTHQVNEVAYEIGYESVSQFSNEYKTYFGYSPKDTPKAFKLI